MLRHCTFSFFFFFNDTATTEIYTLSLHDALPILKTLAVNLDHSVTVLLEELEDPAVEVVALLRDVVLEEGYDFKDRKSTRLNSSHLVISYAVFCLKKKKKHFSDIAPYRSVVSIVG